MGKTPCGIITLPPNVFLSHSPWEKNTEVLQIFSEEELLSEAWREKEICKTCGGCLGLRSTFLLFVTFCSEWCPCLILLFSTSLLLLPESQSANPCRNVSPSEKTVRWNSFVFLKDFEIPKMKVTMKHNIVFCLGQGKIWGRLQLRKNPTTLKWRRNTSSKERVCTQVCKVVIQLLRFLIVIRWNKSAWWSSFWASIFLHSHLCPRLYAEVFHLAFQ